MRTTSTPRFRSRFAFVLSQLSFRFALALLLLMSTQVYGQSSVTVPAGSYLIDMGVNANTKPAGLRPYGLIHELIKYYKVPIIWVIREGKTKDAIDYTVEGFPYRAGIFIISSDYVTGAVASAINGWRTGTPASPNGYTRGLVTARTISSAYTFSGAKYDTIKVAATWTLDAQNGQLAQPFFVNAGIPSTAYNWLPPSQLADCDDIFVMPHADPTWATHGNLYSWNLQYRGAIWLGCHAGSALENMYNPADTSQQTNFLSTKTNIAGPGIILPVPGSTNYAQNALVLWNNHAGPTAPFITNGPIPPPQTGTRTYPDDWVSQFLGVSDLAHLNGSEQVFLPVNGQGWRSTTNIVTFDPDQPNIPGKSPGAAVIMAHGRGFGDPARGQVMIEAGHSVDKGTTGDVPAQRGFFNWSLMAQLDKAIRLGDITGITISGNMYLPSLLSVTTSSSVSPPSSFVYSWSAVRKDNGDTIGSFSPNYALGADTTTFTPPVITAATPIVIRVSVTDPCGRTATTSIMTVLMPPPSAPVAINDNAAIDAECYVPGMSTTIPVLENDTDVDHNIDMTSVVLINGTDTSASISQPGIGLWTTNGTTVTFVPAANFFGTASIKYQVCDLTPDLGEAPFLGPLCNVATVYVGVGSADSRGCYPGTVWDISNALSAASATSTGVPDAADATGDPDYNVDDATTYAELNASGDILNLDFGALYTTSSFDTVSVFFATSSIAGSSAGCNVEYSTNGSTWTTLGSISTTLHSEVAKTRFVVPVSGLRYLRFTTQTGANLWIDGAQLEKYGCVSAAPSAADDHATTLEDLPVAIEVLKNDYNPGDYPLKLSIVSGPSNGKVSINPDNTITYLNNTDYPASGDATDVFSYRMCNTQGYCAVATVTVTIKDDGCATGYFKPVTGGVVATKIFQYEFTGTNAATANSTASKFADAWLQQDKKTTNFSGNPLEVGKSFSGGKARRAVLWFDISEIPSSAIVQSATFSIRRVGGDGNSQVNYLHALTRSFVENKVTWNIANTGVNWTTGGGDYNAIALANATVTSVNQFYNFDITGITQTWVSTPAANYGLLMKTGETLDKRHQFASKEHGTDAYHPILTITYLIPEPCAPISNRAPLANPDYGSSTTTHADTIQSLLNDSDPDNQVISVSAVTMNNSSKGSLSFTDTSIIYTPNNSVAVPRVDTLLYTVTDGTATDQAFVYIQVDNARPSVNSDSSVALSGVVQTLNVVLNDADPEDDTLSIPVVTLQPKYGSYAVSDSSITYTPSPSFYGRDTLVYQSCEIHPTGCDPVGLCDTAMVIFIVNNRPPVVTDTSFHTYTCQSVSFSLDSSIYDPEGEPLIVTITSGVTTNDTTILYRGPLVKNGSVYTFTPDPGWPPANTTDTVRIEFVATDPGGLVSNTGIIIIYVTDPPFNQPPVAIDFVFDTTTLAAVGPVNQDLYIDVLENDYDPDGHLLGVQLTPYPGGPALLQPQHGTISVLNGVILYRPDFNFVGIDSFDYVLFDSVPPPKPGCTEPIRMYDMAKVILKIEPLKLYTQVWGTVWDDADGSALNSFSNIYTAGENGTDAGNAVYVYLINAAGDVIDKADVNADGTYKMYNAPANDTGLTLLISTANVAVGSTAPSPSVPAGWTNTSPLITASFNTSGIYVVQDFGIEQYPDGADYTVASQSDPGGTNQVAVPSSAFTGTDPEDGTYAAGLTGRKVDLYPATNGTLYYNGVAVSSMLSITSFDPSLVSIDPAGGGLNTSFRYAVYDNAGKADPQPNLISLLFITVDATVVNIDCFGNNNGSISLTVTGGTAPYSYAWAGPHGYTSASEDISNLAPGDYTVTITDHLGAIVIRHYTISSPTQLLAIGIAGPPINCYGGTTTITINASGGTAPYLGTGTFPVSGGPFSFTVTDAHGCTATVTGNIDEPSELSVSETHLNVLCYGDSTGSIDITVQGGTTSQAYYTNIPGSGPGYNPQQKPASGYSFTWTGPNGFSASTEDISGLPAGTYTVVVKDENNCSKTITVAITQPSSAVVANAAVTSDYNGAQISCAAAADGQITVTASGGTGTLMYAVNSGSPQSSNVFNGLGAGQYVVTVFDENNCTVYDTVTITAPEPLTGSVTAGILHCNEGTVQLVVTASGGTGGYTYSTDGIHFVSSNTFTVVAGTYSVIIKDANGCLYPVNAYTIDNACIALIKKGTYQDANSNGKVDVGDQINYAFTVTNTGNVTLTNVTVTDPLVTVVGGPITLNVGQTDASSFTGSYNITQTDIDAGGVSNQALAIGYDPKNNIVRDTSDDNSFLENDTTTTELPQSPGIALIKSGTYQDANSNGKVDVGDQISYAFTVTNTGNVTLTGVTVTDPKVTVVGGPITLNVGQTDASSFTGSYNITQTDIDAGGVSNQALAIGYDPKNNIVRDTSDDNSFLENDTTTTELPQSPGIALIKKGTYQDANSNGKVDVGDQISYAFTVTNTGNVTLTNVTVTDPKVSVTGGPITLNVGQTDASSFTGSYNITQTDIDAGGVSNQALAIGYDPKNNIVRDTSDDNSFLENDTTTTELPQAPGIALIKSGTYQDANSNGKVDVGDQISYAFTVTNTGNVTLTNVTVTDPLVTVVGGPISLNVGQTDNTSFTGLYNITQLDIDHGTVSNLALAIGYDPKNNKVTDTSDDNSFLENDTTTTELPQAPGIALIKKGTYQDANSNGKVDVGDQISYAFTVTNTGNVTLTNVTVTDPLVTVVGGPITLNVGQTDASSFTGSYNITQTDIDAGAVSNQALAIGYDPKNNQVTDTSDDNSFLENDTTTTELPQAPGIALIKKGTYQDANSNGKVDVGDQISYAFTVTNTGNVTLTNVTVTDPLVTVVGGPITLNVGQTDNTSFTGSYNITQTDIDAGGVSNLALAIGYDPKNNQVTDTSDDNSFIENDTTTTELPQAPGIALIKKGTYQDANSNGKVDVGDQISYAFTVTNTGNVTLTNVTVTDPLVTVVGGPISLNVGQTDNTSFTGSYNITQTDIDAGAVSNQALAIGYDPKNNQVTDTSDDNSFLENDTTTTELPQAPGIALIKSGTYQDANSNGKVDVGDQISYAFTVTNTGNVTLTNVTVTDPKVTVVGGPITLNVGQTDASSFTGSYNITQTDIDAGGVSNQALAIGYDPKNNIVRDTSDDNSFLENDTTTTELPQAPGIALIKKGTYQDANSNGKVDVGDQISYAFTVTNTGNVTLTGVTVTDPKVTVVGGPITLNVGQTDYTTFTGSYNITQTDIDAGGVSNLALAIGYDPKNNQVTDTSDDNSFLENDTTTTELPQAPGIALIKKGTYQDANSNGKVDVGDQINYAFTVTNTGNVTLTNVTVTDPLVTVVGGPITLNVGQTDASSFTGSYNITQTDIDAGGVSNQALAIGYDPKNNQVTDTSDDNSFLENDTTTTELPQAPGIALIKKGTYQDANSNGKVDVGDQISYAFTVTNTGNVTLTNVTVTDPKVSVTGGPITLNVGQTDASSFTGSYNITQTDIDAGGVSNLALAIGYDPKNNQVTDTSDDNSFLENDTTTTELPQAPGIALIKSGTYQDANSNGKVDVGDQISYAFTVTNTGNVTLTGVTVTDPKVTVVGGPITLNVGQTDPSSFTGSYNITQTDIDAGAVSNQALAIGYDPKNNQVADTSDDNSFLENDTTTTELPQAPGIALIKKGTYQDANSNGKVDVGDQISYAFTVTNTGNVTLTGVTVTDPKVTVVGGPITLNVAQTDASSFTGSYNITQTDIDAGGVSNLALAIGYDPKNNQVTDTSDDNSLLENDTTTTELPQAPGIALIKKGTYQDANSNGKVDVGDQINYAFTVTNTGNVTLTNVTVTDPLVTVVGGPITLNVGQTDASSFTGTYNITQTDIDAGGVSNLALAIGYDPKNNIVRDTSDDNSFLENDTTTTELPQAPGIALIKKGTYQDANSNGKVDVGDQISYAFTVTNTGNVTLTSVTVTDPLVTVVGGPITLNVGQTDATSFTGLYSITQLDIDHGSVSNLALAIGYDPKNNQVTDTSDDNSFLENDTTTTELPQSPGIALIKSGTYQDANSNGKVDVGDQISYAFTVTNTGNVTLTNVTVTDPLVTVVGGPITLNVGQTDASSFTGTYNITQTDIDAGGVSNQALATGYDPKNNIVRDTSDDNSFLENDTTTTELPQAPGIALIKKGTYQDANSNGKVDVGDQISYAFTVTNTGNVTLTGVTVTDPKVTVVGGPITLNVGQTDASSFTGSYNITQTDIDAGGVSNQALAIGYDPKNNIVRDTSDDNSFLENDTTTTELPQSPGIALIKKGTYQDANSNGKVDVGDQISYAFTVTNTGNVTLTNVTVTDPKVTVVGGPITLNVGQTDASSFTGSYNITQTDIDAGGVSNQALAIGYDPKNNIVRDTSDDNSFLENDTTTTELPQAPGIALIKKGTYQDANSNGKVDVGDQISYAFTVTNTGNVTLTNVTVTDPLVTVVGGPITLNVGQTDASSFTGSYNITQTDIDAGGVSNQALAIGYDPKNNIVRDTSDDNSFLENDTTTTELPQAPGIALIKKGTYQDANSNGKVDVGDQISYAFTVTNTGNVTLTNVTVTDPLVTVVGGPITLNVGQTDASSFTGSYNITQTDIDAGGVKNQALAIGYDPKNNIVRDTSDDNSFLENDTTTTELPQAPGIALIKKGTYKDANSNGKVDVGDQISYAFTVTNTGNVTLTNVTVTDPLVTVLGGPITLNVGQTDASSFTGSYNITQTDIDAGGVSNQALAIGYDPKNNIVRDTSDDNSFLENDTTTTELPQSPGIALIKKGTYQDGNSNGKVDVGDQISYAFTVTNTGNVTLTNVTVTDPLVTVVGGPITLNVAQTDASSFTGSYNITQTDIDAGGVSNLALAIGYDPKNNQVTDTSDDNSFLENDTTTTELPQAPGIALIKSGTYQDANSNGKVDVGDQINYAFTVTNTGNVTLTNVTVTDPKVSVTGGPITLNVGQTDASSFTGLYNITQLDIDHGSVSNLALAIGYDPKNNQVTDTSDDNSFLENDTTTTELPQAPGIALIKKGTYQDANSNGKVDVGDQISYAFTVTNTGNVTLTNVTVTDPKVSVTGGPITLNVGQTDATSFTGLYSITQLDIDHGSVSNLALAIGYDPKNNQVTDTSDDNSFLENDTTTTELPQAPGIALIKKGTYQDANSNGKVDVGDQISYAFTVTNTGNVTLTNVTVTDPLVTVVGGPISLNVGQTDNTSFTGLYNVTQLDIDHGSVSNLALAIGYDPKNNQVTDTSDDNSFLENDTTTTELPQAPGIALIKKGTYQDANSNGKVDVGDQISYAFTVTNTGNVTLTNVTVTDPLVTVVGGPISLNVGQTDASSFTGSYNITQTDIDAGGVSNQALAIGYDPKNNQVTDTSDDNSFLENDTTTTELPQAPGIALIKKGTYQDANSNGKVDVGDQISYAFTVTNTGNVTLTNVTVTDPLVTVVGGPITLNVGQTDASSFTGTYNITQTDIDAGGVSNQALAIGYDPKNNIVSDTSDDNSFLENDTTTTELPRTGSWTISKVAMQRTYCAVETMIDYQIRITNTGNVSISSVLVTDPGANAQSPVYVSGDNGNLVLDPLETWLYTAKHQVTSADITSGEYTNIATAHGTIPSNLLPDVSDTATIYKEQLPPPQIDVVQPGCTIAGGTITIISPIGGFTYSVDGINYQTSPVFSGLAPGTYYITKKLGADGCVSPAKIVVINPAPAVPPMPTVTVVQPTCTTPTGTITVIAPVGYLFSIDGINYQTSPVFSGLAPGTYNITKKLGADGCVSPAKIVVINPAPAVPPMPTVTVVQPTCSTPTGTITVIAPVGYLFSIDGITYQTSPVFSGLAPGTYNITKKLGADGCVSPAKIVVINPAPEVPLRPIVIVVHPTCTTPTGTITVQDPTGYVFSINGMNYQVSPVFSGLAPGTYYVTRKNADGCVSPAKIVVINPAPAVPPMPTVTVVQPTCTTPTGTITVIAPVGYLFSIDGVNYQTSPVFSGLAPGTYNITKKLGPNGCVSPAKTVVINPAPAVPPMPTVAVVQPTCTTPTGTITVIAPVGYLFSIDGVNYQTSPVFSGLAPGTYYITKKLGADGCVSPAKIVVINPAPAVPPMPTVTVVQPTCSTPTGTITVIAPVGYSFSIDGVNYQLSPVFSGLTPGTYSITKKLGADGCVSSAKVVVINPAPEVPLRPIVTVVQPTCTTPTGTITLIAQTGYVFSINGVNYQASPVFSGLAPGTYNVTMKTTDGCVSPAKTVVINPAPEAPPMPYVSVVQPTCSTPAGTITVIAPTGYTFSIDGINYQVSPVFTGLAPGNYYVTKKNADGCVSPAKLVVINAAPAVPPMPTVAVVQPTCTTPTGAITVIAPLGYLFSIDGVNYQTSPVFSGLAPGTYNVTKKTSDGCVSPAKTVVINPAPGAPPMPYVSVVQPTCSTPAGTITVIAPTGYTFSIDGINYQVSPVFTGLAPGSYYVTKKNADGCVSPAKLVVINAAPAVPPMPTVTVVQPTCTTPTGTITVIAPTGYLFSINGINYQTSPVFSGLAPGTYYITKKFGADGCISPAKTVVITQASAAPMPTVTVVQPACDKVGTITVTSPLGTGYVYSINGSPFQASTQFTGLTAGFYQITVKNAAGCVSPAYQVTLTGSQQIPQPVVQVSQPGCGCRSGVINIVSPLGWQYSYSIDGVNYQLSPTFGNVPPGIYFVTVRQFKGCVSAPVKVVISGLFATQPGVLAKSGCVNVYPNPYTDVINFSFVPAESGKAKIEIFDLYGRKLATAFEGDVVKETRVDVRYNVALPMRVPVVYRITTASGVESGKLLPTYSSE